MVNKNTARAIRLTEKWGAHNYRPLPVVLARGKGVWVWDVDGRKYLDMLSSYSAVNQGHLHPRLIRAAHRQLGRLTLTSRAFYNDQLAVFFEKICKLTGMDKVLPMNSGAEAVETAIKAARKWGYLKKRVPANKAEIVVCENNFHGRTTTVISFSTTARYRTGFGPYTPGFKIIPFNDLAALRRAINKNTAAFLVEPIQGEGGINIPDRGYIRQACEICQSHNVLFIADEIQTGLGRTGKLFCYQYEGIKPDMLIVGKALSGGLYPVSAVLARADAMNVFEPGDHGSTFGGNPLAAAIACAALDVIIDERLPQRAARLGDYFLRQLRKIKSDKVREVRGKGLLIGVEIKPRYGKARSYCEQLLEAGMLTKETHDYVIRFAPPLVIQRPQIDWALKRIRSVFEDRPASRT